MRGRLWTRRSPRRSSSCLSGTRSTRPRSTSSSTRSGRILEEIVHNDREESTVSPSLLEEGPLPNPEEYLITILSNLQAFSRVLRERIGALGRIKFSDLIAGMPLIEAARTFILLLFAASNGTVVLDQEGEDDLLVILVG